MPEQYIRKPNTKCAVCGTLVYRRPSTLVQSEGKAYCSSACYGIACRKEKPCVVCGRPILSSKNRKTCSRACSNTNRLGTKYKIGSPNDKVKSNRLLKTRLLRHRSKVCERCGYGKIKILQVHHKDWDSKNNTFKNLELLCPNCHCEEHIINYNGSRRGAGVGRTDLS